MIEWREREVDGKSHVDDGCREGSRRISGSGARAAGQVRSPQAGGGGEVRVSQLSSHVAFSSGSAGITVSISYFWPCGEQKAVASMRKRRRKHAVSSTVWAGSARAG
jgi:hypothetical protein